MPTYGDILQPSINLNTGLSVPGNPILILPWSVIKRINPEYNRPSLTRDENGSMRPIMDNDLFRYNTLTGLIDYGPNPLKYILDDIYGGYGDLSDIPEYTPSVFDRYLANAAAEELALSGIKNTPYNRWRANEANKEAARKGVELGTTALSLALMPFTGGASGALLTSVEASAPIISLIMPWLFGAGAALTAFHNAPSLNWSSPDLFSYDVDYPIKDGSTETYPVANNEVGRLETPSITPRIERETMPIYNDKGTIRPMPTPNNLGQYIMNNWGGHYQSAPSGLASLTPTSSGEIISTRDKNGILVDRNGIPVVTDILDDDDIEIVGVDAGEYTGDIGIVSRGNIGNSIPEGFLSYPSYDMYEAPNSIYSSGLVIGPMLAPNNLGLEIMYNGWKDFGLGLRRPLTGETGWNTRTRSRASFNPTNNLTNNLASEEVVEDENNTPIETSEWDDSGHSIETSVESSTIEYPNSELALRDWNNAGSNSETSEESSNETPSEDNEPENGEDNKPNQENGNSLNNPDKSKFSGWLGRLYKKYGPLGGYTDWKSITTGQKFGKIARDLAYGTVLGRGAYEVGKGLTIYNQLSPFYQSNLNSELNNDQKDMNQYDALKYFNELISKDTIPFLTEDALDDNPN